MSPSAHAHWQGKDLILNVYVQPRASRTEVSGWHDRGIKIRLKAPPVDGEANRQLSEFLAKCFAVAKSSVNLVKGESGRQKTVCIHQPNKLPDWLDGLQQ